MNNKNICSKGSGNTPHIWLLDNEYYFNRANSLEIDNLEFCMMLEAMTEKVAKKRIFPAKCFMCNKHQQLDQVEWEEYMQKSNPNFLKKQFEN